MTRIRTITCTVSVYVVHFLCCSVVLTCTNVMAMSMSNSRRYETHQIHVLQFSQRQTAFRSSSILKPSLHSQSVFLCRLQLAKLPRKPTAFRQVQTNIRLKQWNLKNRATRTDTGRLHGVDICYMLHGASLLSNDKVNLVATRTPDVLQFARSFSSPYVLPWMKYVPDPLADMTTIDWYVRGSCHIAETALLRACTSLENTYMIWTTLLLMSQGRGCPAGNKCLQKSWGPSILRRSRKTKMSMGRWQSETFTKTPLERYKASFTSVRFMMSFILSWELTKITESLMKPSSKISALTTFMDQS